MVKLKEGDNCRLKDDNYLWCKVKRILPRGTYGRKCILVECICSPDKDPVFGMIKVFRAVDLRKVD